MVIMPYFGKRKQVIKVIFLVNEQICLSFTLTSMQYHDLFDLNIFQLDECFCSKLGLEIEHAKTVQSKNIDISDLDDCHLLPFVKVGKPSVHRNNVKI